MEHVGGKLNRKSIHVPFQYTGKFHHYVIIKKGRTKKPSRYPLHIYRIFKQLIGFEQKKMTL